MARNTVDPPSDLGLDAANDDRDLAAALQILADKGLDPQAVIERAAANMEAWSSVPDDVRLAVRQPPDEE